KHHVAFTATLTGDRSIGHHQVVKYDRVLTNIGRAYNPWTGHFRARYSGIYLISCTAMSERGYESYMEIVKNHHVLTTLFSNSGTYPMSSQTLVLRLRRGDRIWVWGRESHQVLNDNSNFNVFSGVLLY
ncbi:complement C1q-like protein 3, partial [Saccostrea cucullata]|uniref:complement C1q-like protein 3 n=1 Tax=Saccostrea cuccullata TaxID=36930 RepID=UPI002ED288A7